jgi:hypothetical protein
MNLKKKLTKEVPLYLILPILLISAVIPLIVHLKMIPIDDKTFQFWIGDKQNADFFSYYKATFTIIFSIAALVMFVIARYMNILQTKKLLLYYIPLSIYAIMTVISTLNSKYPSIAQNGFVDRYEGVYLLLSYLAILFTTINLVNNIKFIRIIVIGLFVSAGILGTIGVFQFFGVDFFKSSFAKPFILPSVYKNTQLNFTFGAYTIYTTLYNTNFVGSYTAMLLPLMLAVFAYARKTNTKILTGIAACVMFATWIGCRSRAGYIGGVVAILLLIILMRKMFLKNWKTIIPLLVCFILIFIGMDSAAEGGLAGRILTTITNISDYNAVSEQQKLVKPSDTVSFKDLVLAGKQASIIYGKDTLNLVLSGNQVLFNDTQGKELITKSVVANEMTFEDKRYSSYKVVFDSSNNTFTITLNKMSVILYVDQTGFKIVGERGILLDKIEHAPFVGFNGQEKFASSRGYIWSRSIPLLKNNILIGAGPDTFVTQFPQHDYVGKLKAFDKVNEIVDKPHNWYLQMGINTGVVSLIAVLFLLGTYILLSMKIYVKKNETELNVFGIGFLAAIVGYVITGFANDSLVSVAPVFWTILGLGIVCNYLNSDIYATQREAELKAIPQKNTNYIMEKRKPGKK